MAEAGAAQADKQESAPLPAEAEPQSHLTYPGVQDADAFKSIGELSEETYQITQDGEKGKKPEGADANNDDQTMEQFVEQKQDAVNAAVEKADAQLQSQHGSEGH